LKFDTQIKTVKKLKQQKKQLKKKQLKKQKPMMQ